MFIDFIMTCTFFFFLFAPIISGFLMENVVYLVSFARLHYSIFRNFTFFSIMTKIRENRREYGNIHAIKVSVAFVVIQ